MVSRMRGDAKTFSDYILQHSAGARGRTCPVHTITWMQKAGASDPRTSGQSAPDGPGRTRTDPSTAIGGDRAGATASPRGAKLAGFATAQGAPTRSPRKREGGRRAVPNNEGQRARVSGTREIRRPERAGVRGRGKPSVPSCTRWGGPRSPEQTGAHTRPLVLSELVQELKNYSAVPAPVPTLAVNRLPVHRPGWHETPAKAVTCRSCRDLHPATFHQLAWRTNYSV